MILILQILFKLQKIHVWGTKANSNSPLALSAEKMCGNSWDRVVEASCGHDSGFLVVFASGMVLGGNDSSNDPISEDESCWDNYQLQIFGAHLNDGEKAVRSLGSQAGTSGVVTNQSRILYWNSSRARSWLRKRRALINAGADELNDDTRPKVGILECPTPGGELIRTAHGHRYWYGIESSGKLWQISLGRSYIFGSDGIRQFEWERVPNTEQLHVVQVDAGSAHSVFCTADGEAYTWGATSFGMLGHGPTEERKVDEPCRVVDFQTMGKKVVAVAAGAYLSWRGSFTLFLCSDNTLWRSGYLGEEHEAVDRPTVYDTSALRGRHILSITAGEDWAAVVASGRSHADGDEEDNVSSDGEVNLLIDSMDEINI